MTADELLADLLREIRTRFYPRATPKAWGQELPILRQAITWPARWLNDRGAKLPGRRYREILLGLIDDIEKHRKLTQIRRLSAYLLHCVQEHMSHQGEAYYIEAKSSKAVATAAASALRRLKVTETDHTTAILAAAHAVVARKQKRRCRAAVATQQQLF
jgi:hypothetical protein